MASNTMDLGILLEWRVEGQRNHLAVVLLLPIGQIPEVGVG